MLKPTRLNIGIDPWSGVDAVYHAHCSAESDINQHLPTLRWFGRRARMLRPGGQDTVFVEMGVRSIVSTWALLAARPTVMVSIDISPLEQATVEYVQGLAMDAGTAWAFVRASTLVVSPIWCDLLFIDTLHTGSQLRSELRRHAETARRFIAFHDTETFGEVGEDGEPGLVGPIEELVRGDIEGAGRWVVVWHDPANNGLTVVERAQ